MRIESIRDGGTVYVNEELYIDHRFNSPTPYAVYSPKYPNSPNVQPISSEDELRAALVTLFAALQETDFCSESQMQVIERGYEWLTTRIEELLADG